MNLDDLKKEVDRLHGMVADPTEIRVLMYVEVASNCTPIEEISLEAQDDFTIALVIA